MNTTAQNYYVLTEDGDKGPFSEAVIREGIVLGRISRRARLRHANTSVIVSASEFIEPVVPDFAYHKVKKPHFPPKPIGRVPLVESRLSPMRLVLPLVGGGVAIGLIALLIFLAFKYPGRFR